MRRTKEPVDVTNACPVCHETARRDEALLDALQMAMISLTAVDGINNPELRFKRATHSIRQAMDLLGRRHGPF